MRTRLLVFLPATYLVSDQHLLLHTDYLSSQPGFNASVKVSDLWAIVMDGFGPVWPAARTKLDGVSLGDAWVCEALGKSRGTDKTEENSIVPFHKLSQWLTYSLIEPIDKVLGWKIEGRDDQTGQSQLTQPSQAYLSSCDPDPALLSTFRSARVP